MPTARKPRPAYLTREDAEAMIAAAVAAERERSERAMIGLLEAVGAVSAKLDVVARAVADAEVALDVHAGLIRPMAEAFSATVDMVEAAEAAADPSTVN